MSLLIVVSDHIAPAHLKRHMLSARDRRGGNMSPLIAVLESIALVRLTELHALYTGPSRREYVSISRRT